MDGINRKTIQVLLVCFATVLAACGPQANGTPIGADDAASNTSLEPGLTLESLQQLSIESLRQRRYGTTIEPIKLLSHANSASGVITLIASYTSDDNRVYTRMDLPTAPPPRGGYPVLIFVHGWYGRDAAPGFDFMTGEESSYNNYISHFAQNGFIVFSPALRGHGTVDGTPAQGIEYLDAWDNASYLSPMYYAIDVLNLLEGIPALEGRNWEHWGIPQPLALDTGRISISAHSQGGDAALTALAISGEGSSVKTPLATGSIWAGCFGPRLQQAAIYGPMSNTLQAFMSGDGTWTGSAIGKDGSVNPDFVFAYPPDWIGTTDPGSSHWTWQADTWSVPTVRASLDLKFSEMYRVLNEQVSDIAGATFTLDHDDTGRTVVNHDPAVAAAMNEIGAFGFEQYLTEPVHFHHSDQDYYSIPAWNADLSSRINLQGGLARDFTYPKNTHSLQRSDHGGSSYMQTL